MFLLSLYQLASFWTTILTISEFPAHPRSLEVEAVLVISPNFPHKHWRETTILTTASIIIMILYTFLSLYELLYFINVHVQ